MADLFTKTLTKVCGSLIGWLVETIGYLSENDSYSRNPATRTPHPIALCVVTDTCQNLTSKVARKLAE